MDKCFHFGAGETFDQEKRKEESRAQEYRFLTLMEKNSSEVGSFFDPMPSELRGNVMCSSDPSKIAVGWVGVYTTEEQRLFIHKSHLPDYTLQHSCQTTSALPVDKAAIEILLRNYIPIGTTLDPQHNVIIIAMEIPCLDCRVYGTNNKPWFC